MSEKTYNEIKKYIKKHYLNSLKIIGQELLYTLRS